MREELLIAGAGGQGVLFIGELIAKMAIIEGKNATWLPSYGPAMRGGKANCAVIISDKEIGSPLIESPTSLIVMNRPSLIFVDNVIPSGLVILNSSLAKWNNDREDLQVIRIPAENLAKNLGNPKIANVIMLGAYLRARGILPITSAFIALERKLGGKTDLYELNSRALMAGTVD